MKISMTRRSGRAALATFAAASLTLGVAACSDAENGAKDATGKAGDAAGSATSAAGDAKDSATSAAESKKDEHDNKEKSEGASESGAAGAQGDMVEVKDKEGNPVQMPKDVHDTWDQNGGESGEMGAFESTEEGDKGTIYNFADAMIVKAKDSGAAVPVIGKIAETWKKDGGLDNKVGLPKAKEEGDAQQGWTQPFENGTIEWKKNDAGEWAANILDGQQ